MSQEHAAAGGAGARKPIILDCTIRDGSYAIDFKFTAADTALIAQLLDAAGLQYIEIGHGLGLGASEAGKGRAPSRDLEVIERTRERVEHGKIGTFFIPGIGTEAHLRDAASAGMDFVRIGQDADNIEQAWPFVDLARELGLEPFVNFMKTYGIAPVEFAERAAAARARGAVGVYVVDSAGGMLPSEVQDYVRATRDATDAPIGFHGHSNLHLAVANSVAAYDAGATFVDTSVYGIGRSSGNVPTEVMAAVFDRLGIDCGIDAMAIIDIAESYLRPLAEHLHPHTMTAVALGYGRFHSSFLPKAMKAADSAGVNPFRLIVELGRGDMMRLPDDLLERSVAGLEGAGTPELRPDLARFADTRFGPRRIANRGQAVSELLDGLEIVAAKRNLEVVLDLVATAALDEESATAEFVLEDEQMALGRMRFGSAQTGVEVLEGQADRIAVGLLDIDGLAPDAVAVISEQLGPALPHRLVTYRSGELQLAYLGDVALAMLAAGTGSRVVLSNPGTYGARDIDALARRLEEVAPVERRAVDLGDGGGALLVVAGPTGSLHSSASDPGFAAALFMGARDPARGAELERATVLAREDAYRGTLLRWTRALAFSRSPTSAPELA